MEWKTIVKGAVEEALGQSQEAGDADLELTGRAAWPALGGDQASLDGIAEVATQAPSTRVDLVETVAAAIAFARLEAGEDGMPIAYAYSVEPVWVRGDGADLRRAVDDLLARARQSAPASPFAVRCVLRAGEAVLDVLEARDLGGTDLAVLFSEPAQVAKSEAGEAGFEAMRSLVAAHRGAIRVTSSPQSGCRVTVRLPLACA